MANNGYIITKFLRRKGFDVELAISRTESIVNFPEWEEVDHALLSSSITPEKLKDLWNFPNWIHEFRDVERFPTPKTLVKWTDEFIRLRKLIEQYDVIEAHYPYQVHSQFASRPYVIYDAGWIRELVDAKGIRNMIARRAYKKAARIIIANPELRAFLKELKINDVVDISYAIDFDKYIQSQNDSLRNNLCQKSEEILILSATRHDWQYKRNYIMIKGYAKFLKHFPSAVLICVKWGPDLTKSIELSSSLGIANKIIWIEPVVKNNLIQLYNSADIIIDQFGSLENRGGFYGATSAEAMSCAKPVLSSFEESVISDAYNDIPPIINCKNEDDVALRLLELAKSESLRRSIGIKGREWVIRIHSPNEVAQKHINVLRSVIER